MTAAEFRDSSDEDEKFPLIDIEGGAYQRGEQYGSKAGLYIERGIAIYRKAFAKSGLEWTDARHIAKQFAARIESYSSEMAEEFAGIAAGAGLPVEDIIALNARTELLYGHDRAQGHPQAKLDGCTAAIALPSVTADRHLLHGQNWDWRDECASSTIILRVRPDEGPAILTMVEAGGLARCGFNSAGISITGNFLKCQHDDGRDGVPVALVRRSMLCSDNLADAMTRLLNAPRSFSNNVMIGHESGEAIDFETTPKAAYWIRPDQGLLVHANHFSSPGAVAQLMDLGLMVTPDSLYREQRVRSSLSARKDTLTAPDFAHAFADTFGTPNAVCRSPVYGPGGDTVSTVATFIMDVTARKAWIARTPYKGARYWEYSLDIQEPQPRSLSCAQ